MNRPARQSLPTRMAAYIAQHALLRRGPRVIVALSGGADSVALLAALCECGYDCVAAHCNFHLRGDESMRDMHHASEICRRLDVDLTVRDFDVPKRMQLTGESIEMACRSLRYEWFDSLLDRERAQAVAVGHHREDNVETFMLNLLRGTGPLGLCGMRPRNGYVVRPLLPFSRAMIEDYLRERGMEYITDSSNLQNDFKRNRLRNVVLPMLDEQFDGATEAILRTIDQVAESRRLYDRLVAERAAVYLQGSDIRLTALAEAEADNAAMLLYEMLHPTEGFNMSDVRDMLRNPAASGLRFISATGHVRELDRGILSAPAPDTSATSDCYPADLRRDILHPVHITIERLPVAAFRPERNPMVMYADAALLQHSPAPVLRHWRRGDRIEPFGMKGSRAVSDLFNDAKYSADRKRRAWLLCSGDTVLWVCGLRASRHFAVGPGTKEYLRLELK